MVADVAPRPECDGLRGVVDLEEQGPVPGVVGAAAEGRAGRERGPEVHEVGVALRVAVAAERAVPLRVDRVSYRQQEQLVELEACRVLAERLPDAVEPLKKYRAVVVRRGVAPLRELVAARAPVLLDERAETVDRAVVGVG